MTVEPAPINIAEHRACFEGAIPAIVATAAPDGTPNVAYLSQVFPVDERHVALSFQFFNKTRRNVLANPRATVLVLHPQTAQFHRLHLKYLRTEEQGPLFERMKAQLAGIASHSGMASVFRLLGADVYEVERVEEVPGRPLPAPAPRTSPMSTLRRASERLSACQSLDELLTTAMDVLRQLDMPHGMILMLEPDGRRLYTVASQGYVSSGVGSEIALGEGVIGVAARENVPVRISHMTSASLYSQALRNSLECAPETEIPYPGLSEPHSQLAVPIVSGGRVLGVLFVESPQDLRFGFDDEDLLTVLAGQLGAAMDWMQASTDWTDSPEQTMTSQARPPAGPVLRVRHFRANDSVFINDRYLIKGVAGAILRKLLRDHLGEGRSEFSNRELRLDASLGLPDICDNLEARLLLLQRRLQEFGPDLRIEKCGRGRFRLMLTRPVELDEIDG